VKEFVEAGGGLYSMHNNSHVSLSSKNYREVMGGAYVGHPALRPFRVRVVKPGPPYYAGHPRFHGERRAALRHL